MSAKKRFALGHRSSPAVQRPCASLVHATTRPSPNSHVASSGSPVGLWRITSAAARGVVATYPLNVGNALTGTPGRASSSEADLEPAWPQRARGSRAARRVRLDAGERRAGHGHRQQDLAAPQPPLQLVIESWVQSKVAISTDPAPTE